MDWICMNADDAMKQFCINSETNKDEDEAAMYTSTEQHFFILWTLKITVKAKKTLDEEITDCAFFVLQIYKVNINVKSTT